MSLMSMLAIAALCAAVVLLLQGERSLYTTIAAGAAAIEVAVSLGLLSLSIAGIKLGLILGAALAICGVLIYLQVKAKTRVASATVIAVVGIVQLLQALGLG